MAFFQVEVDEDPADAKKDEQDEKAEVLHSFCYISFCEFCTFLHEVGSAQFLATDVLLTVTEEENQDCCWEVLGLGAYKRNPTHMGTR